MKTEQQQVEYVTSLSKYIPSLVLHQLVKRQKSLQKTVLPELQEMETVCLFADISGFTRVGEACAKKGQRGNEDLAFVINRYMEGMVKNLSKYGGDIIKFVGDAMIVMWPQDTSHGSREECARRTVRQAIQCSLDIQREMHNLVIMADVSALQVKMGIGFGTCALLYVGGVFQRQEFFTVGAALTFALDSEGEATAGGQIIVSESAFQWVREFYEAREIIKTDKKTNKQLGRFYHIGKLTGEGIKADAMAAKLVADIPQDVMLRLKDVLEGCLAQAIINYLKIGVENFGSETRSLTVMFVSLGIELSSAETPRGMQRIQDVVVTVQQQVYRQQGSINKLMMDDKGSTLICLWGLTPMCHEDDAARAILCAYSMRKALMDKYAIKLSIGISSGEVFAGVCGTSGSRKEFTSLGDVVNLAARVMYWPKSKGIMGKIHTDLNTKALASNFFSFIYQGHHEFKGKSISLPVYEPIFEIPGDEPYEQSLPKMLQTDLSLEKLVLADVRQKVVSFSPKDSMEQYLKVHANPMNLDPENKPSPLFACEQLIWKAIIDALAYFNEDFEIQQTPFLLAVRGEIGSGKTLFVRNLVAGLIKLQTKFNAYNRGDSGQISLFFSSLNSETQYRWLNIWRPILSQMFAFQCVRHKVTGYDMLKLLIDSYEGQQNDKWVCLATIFDIKVDVPEEYSNDHQLAPNKFAQDFVSAEQYDEVDTEDLMGILLDFMNLVLGMYDKCHEQLYHDYFAKVKGIQKDGSINSSASFLRDEPPFTIIMDSSHLIDENSWSFLEMLCQRGTRVGIVICMQTDTMDKLRISEKTQKAFQQAWQSEALEHLKQIDMPAFDAGTLHKVLCEFSDPYKKSYLKELKSMTDITVDPTLTIKTPEQGKEWIEHFTDLWQLKCNFSKVEDKIIATIVEKCRGNPLFSLQYFVNLLQNRFIEIKDEQGNLKNGKVVATELFLESESLKDFTAVPLPRIAVKINTSLVDSYIRDTQMKKKLRKGEIEQAMKGVVLLKSASVIGEEFELSTLQQIQPMRSESLNGLKTLLKTMEQHDFIEFLEESDSKNALCRFNKPFFRETIYQIILYRDQKKFLHGAIGMHLSEQAPRFVAQGDKGPGPEQQIKILKHHLLLNQDQKTEKDLNQQARAGLVIRRITNKLAANPLGIAWEGIIEKQGSSVNAKAEERLVIVTTQCLRWFHDRREYDSGVFLGSIPLNYIYAVVPARMKAGSSKCFSISTATWYSGKSSKEKDKRDFYFATESVNDRDEWIAAIEFLRTKAIYENFARQNCAVSFPIKMNDEEQVHEEQGVDKGELLFDFGKKFKSKLAVPQLNRTVNTTVNRTNQFDDTRSPNSQGSRRKNGGSSRGRSQTGFIKTKESLAEELKLMYSAGILSFLNHLNLTSVKDSIKSQNTTIGKIPQGSRQKLAFDIRAKLDDFEDDNTSQTTSHKLTSDVKRKSSPDSAINNKIYNPSNTKVMPLKRRERRSSSISASAIIGIQNFQGRQIDFHQSSIKEHDEETDEASPNHNAVRSQKTITQAKDVQSAYPQGRKLPPQKYPTMIMTKSSDKMSRYRGDSDIQGNSCLKSEGIIELKVPLHHANSSNKVGFKNLNEFDPDKESEEYSDRETFAKPQHNRALTAAIQAAEQAPNDRLMPGDGPSSISKGESSQGWMMSMLENVISKQLSTGLNEIRQQQQEMFSQQHDKLTKAMEDHKEDMLNKSINAQAKRQVDTSDNWSNYLQNLNQKSKKKLAGITSRREREELAADVPMSKAGDSDPEDEEEDWKDYAQVSEKSRNPSFKDDSYNKMITLQEQESDLTDKDRISENEVREMRWQKSAPYKDRKIKDMSPGAETQHSHVTERRQNQNPKITEEHRFASPDGIHQRGYKQQQPTSGKKPYQIYPTERIYYPAPANYTTSKRQAAQSQFTVGPPQAIALKNTQCKLRGSNFNIPEGAVVDIIEQIPSVGCYRIRYDAMVGVFAMYHFERKIQEKSLAVEDNTLDLSPIHGKGVSQDNFFREKREKEMNRRLQNFSAADLAEKSKRFLNEDAQVLQEQSLKHQQRQMQKAMKRQQKSHY